MAIRFLYLDDERSDEVEPYAREMQHAVPALEVVVEQPITFGEQLKRLDQGDFDGLILDLRLDQYAHKVGYRAPSLAQEIRTRATEGRRDFPLFLWSTEAKLEKSYTQDLSGHDLFDLKTVKRTISSPENPDQLPQLGSQMIALAKGYQRIQNSPQSTKPAISLVRYLGWEKLPEFLDPRVVSSFELRSGHLPAHEFARFIVLFMLKNPGPLLDLDWLAARLGIDRAESPDFAKLCENHLESASYKGLFALGWPRWWASLVESWWERLAGAPTPLRLVKAEERVAFLKKHLKLRRLVAATPHRTEDSSAFWAVCEATRRPLDPRDGFVLQTPSSTMWNERFYISAAMALKRTPASRKLVLDPSEIERFKRIQAAARQESLQKSK